MFAALFHNQKAVEAYTQQLETTPYEDRHKIIDQVFQERFGGSSFFTDSKYEAVRQDVENLYRDKQVEVINNIVKDRENQPTFKAILDNPLFDKEEAQHLNKEYTTSGSFDLETAPRATLDKVHQMVIHKKFEQLPEAKSFIRPILHNEEYFVHKHLLDNLIQSQQNYNDADLHYCAEELANKIEYLTEEEIDHFLDEPVDENKLRFVSQVLILESQFDKDVYLREKCHNKHERLLNIIEKSDYYKANPTVLNSTKFVLLEKSLKPGTALSEHQKTYCADALKSKINNLNETDATRLKECIQDPSKLEKNEDKKLLAQISLLSSELSDADLSNLGKKEDILPVANAAEKIIRLENRIKDLTPEQIAEIKKGEVDLELFQMINEVAKLKPRYDLGIKSIQNYERLTKSINSINKATTNPINEKIIDTKGSILMVMDDYFEEREETIGSIRVEIESLRDLGTEPGNKSEQQLQLAAKELERICEEYSPEDITQITNYCANPDQATPITAKQFIILQQLKKVENHLTEDSNAKTLLTAYNQLTNQKIKELEYSFNGVNKTNIELQSDKSTVTTLENTKFVMLDTLRMSGHSLNDVELYYCADAFAHKIADMPQQEFDSLINFQTPPLKSPTVEQRVIFSQMNTLSHILNTHVEIKAIGGDRLSQILSPQNPPEKGKSRPESGDYSTDGESDISDAE